MLRHILLVSKFRSSVQGKAEINGWVDFFCPLHVFSSSNFQFSAFWLQLQLNHDALDALPDVTHVASHSFGQLILFFLPRRVRNQWLSLILLAFCRSKACCVTCYWSVDFFLPSKKSLIQWLSWSLAHDMSFPRFLSLVYLLVFLPSPEVSDSWTMFLLPYQIWCILHHILLVSGCPPSKKSRIPWLEAAHSSLNLYIT